MKLRIQETIGIQWVNAKINDDSRQIHEIAVVHDTPNVILLILQIEPILLECENPAAIDSFSS